MRPTRRLLKQLKHFVSDAVEVNEASQVTNCNTGSVDKPYGNGGLCYDSE